MKKIVLAAVAVALFPATAFAAPSGNTSTAAGSASAVIVSPIVLTHTDGAVLDFGKFTTGTGGRVIVDATGNISSTGDVGLVPGATGAADAFTVAGDASRTFSIATTKGTVTGAVSGNTMAFTTTASATGDTLDASGKGAFTVGGRLTVVGTEAADSYTGSYNATVAYN